MSLCKSCGQKYSILLAKKPFAGLCNACSMGDKFTCWIDSGSILLKENEAYSLNASEIYKKLKTEATVKIVTNKLRIEDKYSETNKAYLELPLDELKQFEYKSKTTHKWMTLLPFGCAAAGAFLGGVGGGVLGSSFASILTFVFQKNMQVFYIHKKNGHVFLFRSSWREQGTILASLKKAGLKQIKVKSPIHRWFESLCKSDDTDILRAGNKNAQTFIEDNK